MIVGGKEQIQGWKEIAAYLARDERTVKRWEKQRGLPVRRIPGNGRANVYVVVAELEAWLATRTSQPEGMPRVVGADQVPAEPTSSPQPDHLLSSQIEAAAGDAAPAHPIPRSPKLRGFLWPVVLTICVLVGLGWILAVHHRRSVVLAHAPAIAPAALANVAVPANSSIRQLYLKGVYLYEERTPLSLEQARLSFQQVIDQDPRYAPAYAGLARTYLLLREYSNMPPAAAYAQAEAAARKALALDPTLPEAHDALGFVEFFHYWNAAGATREFETALKLDPRCAMTHHWYGSMLTHEGRYNAAIQQLDQAESLQPNSSAIVASRAFALGLGGHRNEASDLLQSLLGSGFDDASLHRTLGVLSLVQPRDPARYLNERRRFAELRQNTEQLAVLRAGQTGLERGGEPGMWAAMLAQERRFHPSPSHPTFDIVEAEAALGQADQALHDLSLLAQQHDSLFIGVDLDPLLLPLHADPRFRALVLSAGFAPPS